MNRTDPGRRHAGSSPARGDLVGRPVAALGGVVRRWPVVTVAVVLGLTAVLAVLSGQAQEGGAGDGIAPDVPEVHAADTIRERFGDSDEEVVQILVRGGGGSLVSADGYEGAAAIEAAVRGSDAAARIADLEGRPGVVTWMFPVQQAFGGTDPGALGDADVVAAYDRAVAALPADQAGFATALLPDEADPRTADTTLAFVFLDTDGMSDDPDEYFEEMAELQADLADAVSGADLPSGISAEAFSGVLMLAGTDEVFDAELGRLFVGAFAIIVLILGFVYWVRPRFGLSRTRSARRSAADMLLSMAAIAMAIVWMLGGAVLLGPGYLGLVGAMNEFTSIIPILLIGLGVDYAIHLTSRYREEVTGGATVTQAMRGAIGTVGGALVLATVTTALGFLTNIVNPLPILRDFGVLAAVGIVSAFVIMLTFVPAMRLLLDRRAERAGRLPTEALGQSSERVLPELMARSAVLAEKAPIPTLLVTLVLAGLGLFGMSQLETRFSSRDFVPEGAAVLDTLDELTDRFDGGYGEITDVLVTGNVATVDAHNALVHAHHTLSEVDDVVVRGGTPAARSVVTLLAQLSAEQDDTPPVAPAVAEALAAAGAEQDLTLPADADVHALYTALVEAAPDAAAPVLATGPDGTFDATTIRIQTTAGELHAGELIASLDGAFAPLRATGTSVIATSDDIMNEVVIAALRDSQSSSLMITLLVAMLLLIAVFAYQQRQPLLGVVTIIPVVLVVLWTFGMMAATDIPFGPITATIAALAIGIGLPYAIHVTHRFTEDRTRFTDVNDAIRSTVRHTGGAMAGSAFTTMAGFGILVTSSVVPFRQLGTVTVYAVGFSLLAATLVLPSILVLWDRWHHRSRTVQSKETTSLHERERREGIASMITTVRHRGGDDS